MEIARAVKMYSPWKTRPKGVAVVGVLMAGRVEARWLTWKSNSCSTKMLRIGISKSQSKDKSTIGTAKTLIESLRSYPSSKWASVPAADTCPVKTSAKHACYSRVSIETDPRHRFNSALTMKTIALR